MASARLFKVEYSLHMTPFCSWPNCMSYVKRAKKPKQGQQEPVLLQIYKILITIQNHHQGESCNRSFMRVRSASTNLKGKWKISWKITRGHRRDQMQECRDFKKKSSSETKWKIQKIFHSTGLQLISSRCARVWESTSASAATAYLSYFYPSE